MVPLLVACGREPTPSTAVPAPPAVPTPVPLAAEQPSVAPSAAPPAPPPVYPQASIERALADHHAASCQELIYAKGCKRTRTGTLTVHVTVDATGQPTAVTVTDNRIGNDPELVETCVRRKLPTWKFDPPPSGAERSFDVVLHFGDKC